MSEFHVRVVRIGVVSKHPNADKLSMATVDGYPVIFRTGEYECGDLAVYVPESAVVPVDDFDRWGFLGKHNTIGAKRLRGVFSQGILTKPPEGAQEGDDVREALRITRNEPDEDGAPPIHNGRYPSGFNFNEQEPDPGYMPAYDLEALRRHPSALIEGEEVVLTEKIHGECVISSTPISLPNGDVQRISAIKVGDHVLGVDAEGNVVTTKVTHVFANGPADKWLRVSGKRTGLGRGSNFFAVRCTPQHKFWNPRTSCYVAAGDLRPGDSVSMTRNDPGLSHVQRQVLLGKMLGDGSLVMRDHSALIQWSHSSKDGGYSDWTAQALGHLVTDAESSYTSGHGSQMTHRNTKMSFWIKDAFASMLNEEGKRTVPAWVADEVTPLALAFWYMDDGSLSHNEGQEDRVSFAVCRYNEQDCDVLIRGLARLGVVAKFHVYDGYSRLSLSADNAERFFLLVAPYIPRSMQRKLPERYRGHEGWLPTSTQEYKPALVEQSIVSVDVDTEVKSEKYDIETETHNYFANGVLVHNSSRYVFRDDRLYVASHRTYKRKPAEDGRKNQWWEVARIYGLEEKLSRVPGIAIYGESHGYTGGFPYGSTPGTPALRLFDAYDTKRGQWFDHDDLVALATALDLPLCPVLYRGPWYASGPKRDALLALAEGPSTLDPRHTREGFVVRPVHERAEHFGRVVLKRVGEAYLLQKYKPKANPAPPVEEQAAAE
jgi:tRNA-binding EMAP/Myf-like protein